MENNTLVSLTKNVYNSDNPLVSIIIPVYNGADYMKEAIDSALAQTYQNIEIIVVNDGSKDNTEEIALSYGDKIKYFSKENGGVATALNLAIENAKGEYISWLSHDDTYYTNKIERQIEELQKLPSKNVLLCSNYEQLRMENKTKIQVYMENDVDYVQPNKLFPSLKTLMMSILQGCTLLIPKVLFEEVGLFNVDLKTTQDYELWYKFIKKGFYFHHIKEPLVVQRLHKNQDTNTKFNLHMQEVKQLNEFAVELFKSDIKTFSIDEQNFFVSNLESKSYFELAKYIKPLSILQIGDNDLIGNKFNGHDLHSYLRENQIEANHFVIWKESNDNFTYVRKDYSKNFAKEIMENKLFSNADLLHLHLIHNTDFDINLLPLITKLKPVVITLHDPYFLGGHCIYHFNCDKWKKHCLDCTRLNSHFAIEYDNTAISFAEKKFAIQNSNISAIVASKWMEDKVKQSPIWKNKKIHRIPFGINQNLFKPADKTEAKLKLGIDKDSLTIMFRSDPSEYKGLDIIKEALRQIKTNSKEKITLITVAQKGHLKEFKNKFNIIEYDWVKEDNLLIQLYQACDLFLMPSKQEAFGMMAIEAMSCGVPVLATKGTALEDVIAAPEIGIAVEHDSITFADELQRLIDNPAQLKELGEKALQFAQKNYNKDTYVNKIIQVYKETMENHQLDDEAKLILEQLSKYANDKEKILDKCNAKRKKIADNKLWRLFYRVMMRPPMKLIYGKQKTKEKYDARFL